MNIAIYIMFLIAISSKFKIISSYSVPEEDNSEIDGFASYDWTMISGFTRYDLLTTTSSPEICNCRNGYCEVDDWGTATCKCFPEWGHTRSYDCKKCDCGEGANCTFNGWFMLKTCICKEGYVDDGGVCRENGTPIFWSTIITVFNDSITTTDGIEIDITSSVSDNSIITNTMNVSTNTAVDTTETATVTFSTVSDLCTENPCKNGGICQMEDGVKKCYCKSPFTGEFCENDPCTINFCRNGGTCRVQNTTFYCNCDAPFYGQFCEKDPCSESPCQNGGSCFIRRNSFVCDCKQPYVGTTCELDSTTCPKLIIIAVLATTVAFFIVYSICLSVRRFKR